MIQQHFILPEEPMGKPRMTRADSWKKRPCVLRYRAYADRLRHACRGINKDAIGVSWVAFFPMPESWSAKKKAAMKGKLHRTKPDRDNIDKGVLDALFKEGDQGISTGSIAKYWDDGKGARIEISVSAEGDDAALRALAGRATIALTNLGVPAEVRQRQMAAFVFLAFLGLAPGDEWSKAQCPRLTITEAMRFMAEKYRLPYAPNTRETVRFSIVNPLVGMGILLPNPDKKRPPQSPDFCYQISPDTADLLRLL